MVIVTSKPADNLFISSLLTTSTTPINLASIPFVVPGTSSNSSSTSLSVVNFGMVEHLKPTNVFDAVLSEASDLLAAAQEAQTFGRLKMASAYSLLVHARLVGLGKRFDRSISNRDMGLLPGNTCCSSSPTQSKTKTSDNTNPSLASAVRAGNLTKYIPNGEHLVIDNELMEHLARSAGELHNKRTGRGKMHKRAEQTKKLLAADSHCSNNRKNENTKLWTEYEKRQCLEAAARYGKDKFSEIAKSIETKTESQVKIYIRNFMGREKNKLNFLTTSVKQCLEKEDVSEDENLTSKRVDEQKTKQRKVNVDRPIRRGGRGKKSPTGATHTVPYAKFDARTLLTGRPLSH